jgi:hypothetical protein
MTAAIEIAVKNVNANKMIVSLEATCWPDARSTIKQKMAMARAAKEKIGTTPQGERTAVVMLIGSMTLHQVVSARIIMR